MSCLLNLYLDNSVSVEIILTNPLIDPVFVNDAAVTARILDPQGVEVQAVFALPFVAGSEGVYRETIAPVAALVAGTIYSIIIDATGSDGVIGRFNKKIKAKVSD